jgi:hypothetical protein
VIYGKDTKLRRKTFAERKQGGEHAN